MKQREIKFRAWDKEKNRMSKPLTFSSMLLHWDDGDSPMPVLFSTAKSRVMFLEFTGAKDRNSEEIYEGYELDSDRDGLIGIVEMHEMCWSLRVTKAIGKTGYDIGCSVPLYELALVRASLTGKNIYQNPEILK